MMLLTAFQMIGLKKVTANWTTKQDNVKPTRSGQSKSGWEKKVKLVNGWLI